MSFTSTRKRPGQNLSPESSRTLLERSKRAGNPLCVWRQGAEDWEWEWLAELGYRRAANNAAQEDVNEKLETSPAREWLVGTIWLILTKGRFHCLNSDTDFKYHETFILITVLIWRLLCKNNMHVIVEFLRK